MFFFLFMPLRVAGNKFFVDGGEPKGAKQSRVKRPPRREIKLNKSPHRVKDDLIPSQNCSFAIFIVFYLPFRYHRRRPGRA